MNGSDECSHECIGASIAQNLTQDITKTFVTEVKGIHYRTLHAGVSIYIEEQKSCEAQRLLRGSQAVGQLSTAPNEVAWSAFKAMFRHQLAASVVCHAVWPDVKSFCL